MCAWTVIDPERISRFDIFSSLTGDEMREIGRLVTVSTYRKDDLIFAEGTPGDTLCLVMDGAVRVSRSIPGMGDEALAILPEGTYFGEMALFDDQKRSADVYADKRTTIWTIDVGEFRAFLADNQSTALKFVWACARTLAERVRQANAKVTFLSAAGKFQN